ncbi:MAG: winged helix-turn-helix transcriptional regulator [Dehalococcoidaceae bacterium]|nr:winged helix-turn-helix transcriptional regulator [Dehalococcoidaceae bacterium]
MENKVKIFKALSDETRLRILSLIIEQECCVCEVMQTLNISQTRASRNLSQLYNAGLLILRKEGLWSLYSVDRQKVEPFTASLLGVITEHFNSMPVFRKDRENLKKAVRVGANDCRPPCCRPE